MMVALFRNLGLGTQGFHVCNMQMIQRSYFCQIPSLSIQANILIYCFELLSGLPINFRKSSIYLLGPAQLLQIVDVVHCRMGSFPFTYLDVPLNPTALSTADWQPLFDKINQVLSSWKGHSLSRGGRLVIVNSILTSRLLSCLF